MLGQVVPLAVPVSGPTAAAEDAVKSARLALPIMRGHCRPFGATARAGGVNFALFSRHAQAVHLLLYREGQDFAPFAEIPLDPATNKTGDVWHVFVRGLSSDVHYAYRVNGPFNP